MLCSMKPFPSAEAALYAWTMTAFCLRASSKRRSRLTNWLNSMSLNLFTRTAMLQAKRDQSFLTWAGIIGHLQSLRAIDA